MKEIHCLFGERMESWLSRRGKTLANKKDLLVSLMKEKRMEEHAKTEEQLLEEQLQAVTGGCADCVGDRINASRLLNRSAQREALSLQPGLLPRDRQTLIDEATNAHREAHALLDRAAARHPTRHLDPLDIHI